MPDHARKLTLPSIEILRRMADGWQLVITVSMDGETSACLQYGGIGRGGEVKKYSTKIVEALISEGQIVETIVSPCRRRFDLTKVGREAVDLYDCLND